MNKISVIGLIAYDYELLLESIPTYIEHVDEIILGIDRIRKSWSNIFFEVPESFFERLKALDPQNKIKIVEDEFWLINSVSTDLMTRQRNMLSTHVADGNWIVSIDADEFLLDLPELTSFLRNYNDETVLIYANWITLFKKIGDNYLIIENDYEAIERFPLATRLKNSFTFNRHTAQTVVFSPICAVHKSWARTPEEFDLKLAQRGGFSLEEFAASWRSLDESNYKNWKDFHPTDPTLWQKLVLIPESDLMTYALAKSTEAHRVLAWQDIPSRARLKAFSDKIIARDANLQLVKQEHNREVVELRAAFESRMAEQVRKMKDLKLQLDAELLAGKARRQNEANVEAKKIEEVSKNRGVLGQMFKSKD
jgi:hypothetical protein